MRPDVDRELAGQQKALADFLHDPAPKCMESLSMAALVKADSYLRNTNLGFIMCLGMEAGLTAGAKNPDAIQKSTDQLITIVGQAKGCLGRRNFHDRDIQALKSAVGHMRVIATGILESAQTLAQDMTQTGTTTQSRQTFIDRCTVLHTGIMNTAEKLNACFSPRPVRAPKVPPHSGHTPS
ncbi:MAG: hypothetical protein WBK91_10030 [Alphaproteobacteria bacterium]